MNGGHLLVECLKRHGVELAFGVPGESYLAVLDALHDARNAIHFVNARQEGGAVFMAAAYGKLTGRTGVAMVTRGPGATNASIGVHTAMQDSTPMVLFVGQVASTDIGREAFQEIDYRAFFGPVAKWVCEIDRAERIPELVMRAFAVAASGRPGPVVVSLPEDVLTHETDAEAGEPVEIAEPHPGERQVARALDLLRGAERPLIIAGGGGWNEEGRAALQAFAEAADLPVAVTFRCQDMIDNGSPSYVGDAGLGKAPYMSELLDEADVILALGVRFGETLTDGYRRFAMPEPKQRIVHVHASADELGKIVRPELAIHAGVNTTLAALRDGGAVDGSRWAERTRQAHATWRSALDAPAQDAALDMAAVMRHLRDVLPKDAIVTSGAGNFSIWNNKHLDYPAGRRMVSPQSGSMGYGVPAAVVARMVHPERLALCFAGDGDFQMTGMELATAAQEKAAPVVLVVNNGMYGTIRMHQERDFPERVVGTELKNPDFSKMAESFGMAGERVERTEDFPAAFERAVASPTGAVIDLVVNPDYLTPARTVADWRAA